MSCVSHGSVTSTPCVAMSFVLRRRQITRCVAAVIEGGHRVTGDQWVDRALGNRSVAALFVPHDAGIHHGGQQPVYFQAAGGPLNGVDLCQ